MFNICKKRYNLPVMDNSEPRVSILLPVYNAAKTLEEALDSIISQSMASFEVVAVDDGSEDDSSEILKAWAKRDKRFKPIFSEHQGIVKAPNKGLQYCRGVYVARMDADDRMHIDRLKKQTALLDASPGVSVVTCLVEMFSHEGDVGEGMKVYEKWLNGLATHSDIFRERFIESPIANPTSMMRRYELNSFAGYHDRGWPEDYDLWLRYAHAGKRFEKIQEVLFYWREHKKRVTHNESRYSVENFLRAKAYYLCKGPLSESQGLIVWGAGKTGRRLSKHLIRQGYRPDLFIDVTPKKIGSSLYGVPIVSPDDLLSNWNKLAFPSLLVAVASRGAREKIRERLKFWKFFEAKDFWCVA